MLSYDYDYEFDKRYVYPDSRVLINKLDIHDEKQLEIAERKLTSANAILINKQPIKGKFDFKHLCDIHKAIFGDVYEWAGKLRTVDIAKGNLFTKVAVIHMYAEDIFSNLSSETFLRKTPNEEVANRLSYYFGEINALHPFREGNGRTQRIFIDYLAKSNGFQLDFSKVSKEEMIEASVTSIQSNSVLLDNMFQRIIEPISYEMQCDFCSKIGMRPPAEPKQHLDMESSDLDLDDDDDLEL
jgi:cell filamentation protein